MSLLSKASIDPMVLSEHNPISITLDISTVRSKNMVWRLNNSILTDIDITQKRNTRLLQYFAENVTADSKQSSIWAMHKCVIRGEIISLTAKRKKLRYP